MKHHFKATNTPLEPVSRLEIDNLKTQREKPVCEQNLTIGGVIESYTHSHQHKIRENRIVKLETILKQYKNKGIDNFNMNADDYLQSQPLKVMTEKELNHYFDEQSRDKGY